jgi:23S rRNA (cytosine1962-C5)-methyltransferase
MEQPFGKFLMFENRLEKVYRHLSKQAKRQGIECYRIYDHDIPEFPFLIEIYGQYLYTAEYKRNYIMEEEEHERWLQGCLEICSKITRITAENIFIKQRQKKESRLGQYQKLSTDKKEMVVHEGGLKFIVNLSDYLDTGLFLDHRITRQLVKDQSANKAVLNLFAYTGSFSVYAVAGGAARVVTIDLSKTYLNWAERNMNLNFPDYEKHQLLHADVKAFLKEEKADQYDLIIMDPPTFSNSKRMDDILDVQRDHVGLINDCIHLLKKEGVLYFSTNYTKFILEKERINASLVKDITKATTPFDFTGKLKRQCFQIYK